MRFELISLLVLMGHYNWLYRDNIGRSYKENKTDAGDPQMPSSVYLGLQVLAHAVAIWGMWRYPGFTSVRIVGFCMMAVGLALLTIAKSTLGSNYSPCQDSFLPGSITASGIYARIRHPLYTANMIYFTGMACAGNTYTGWASAFALSIFFIRSAVVEEHVLTGQFPEYANYQQRTKRFIPYIY